MSKVNYKLKNNVRTIWIGIDNKDADVRATNIKCSSKGTSFDVEFKDGNKKYNFEDKFAALLSNTTRSVTREIKDGFVSLPKGCYIQLEKKAARYILDNIRASYGNSAGLVSRIATFAEDTGLELKLANFLDYYHIDARSIYKFDSFSRLCVRADAINDFEEPAEEALSKAMGRFAAVDSRRWIAFLINILKNIDNIDFSMLSDLTKLGVPMAIKSASIMFSKREF